MQFLLLISLSIILWLIYAYAIHYSEVLVLKILTTDPNTTFLSKWIYNLYPRLYTEQWRFDNVFFIHKSHQLLIRNTIIIQFILIITVYWNAISIPFKIKKQQLFQQSIPSSYLNKVLTPVLYLCLLFVVYDAIFDFTDLIYFKGFYTPIGIAKMILPSFPSYTTLWIIYITLLLSITSVIFFPYKWISSSLALLAFIYYQLLFYGFNKFDHGYTTLTYAMMVYPFVLYEQEKFNSKSVNAWGVILIQLLICLAYFYGGMEKILISGWSWISENTFQQHLILHQTHWGLILSKNTLLCQMLSICVIIFQCSFILLPFFKKLKYILLPIGLLFHTLTWILLDAGGLINPWWIMYLFFLVPLQPLEIESNPVD